MASITDYPRVLGLAPKVSAALDARGNDIPPWLDLGWIWLESAGKVGDADTSVASLGGELGLFQLSADERNATGFTSAQRMTGDDADYQIAAGHALIDYYGGKVAALGITSDEDPLYWMLIKAMHGGGRGFVTTLVNGYNSINGSLPASWDDFALYARTNPYNGRDAYTEHHLSNTESVRSNGLALAAAANLVPPIGGAAAGLVPLAVLSGVAYLLFGRA